MDTRQQQLMAWLETATKINVLSCTPLPGDASFRRYFRIQTTSGTYLAMDSPPEREDPRPFVALDKLWHAQGICVPHIYAEDCERGFLLLEDFGDCVLLNALTAQTANTYYQQAIDELLPIHTQAQQATWPLPYFDAGFMQKELDAFTHWYVERYLEIKLSAAQHQTLENCFSQLITSACEQPQVTTHRDYHSRNLMCLADGRLGIIDFQDAVIGPLCYDVVSLIRDCYIDWPTAQVYTWLDYFKSRAIEAGLLNESIAHCTFRRWFDWMGMQRHLKAIFIFARKYLRDQDARYLPDIDRALNYVHAVCGNYQQLRAMQQLLEEVILPTHITIQECHV